MKFAGNIGTKTLLFQQNKKYNIPESAPHVPSRKQFYYAFDVQGVSQLMFSQFSRYSTRVAWSTGQTETG